jgi:hypothetical protein
MAIHADIERRNAGVPALLGREMTVGALNLKIARVEFVRIGDRLRRFVALGVARKTHGGHQRDQADGEGCR